MTSEAKSKKKTLEGETEELVVVYRSMGLLRAHVIKGKLQSAGIPAMLQYESAGPVMGIIMDGLGEVAVLVPKSHEQAALDVLKTD